MTDRENVIKGLEVCTSIADGESCPKECPYYQEVCYGYDQLMLDALALLKEQDNCENCAIAIEDRQPVVRCKDCIHKNGLNHCTHNNDIWVADDWFCADGEVRGET